MNKTKKEHKLGYYGTSKVQISGRIQLPKELLQTVKATNQREFDIYWDPKNDDIILQIRK